LLVIVGPMTVTSRAAKSSTFASEQVQAFFLAQEGLELAQKLRDDLLLAHFSSPANPWATFTNVSGIYQRCHSSGGCGLEWSNFSGTIAPPVDCGVINNCQLYLKNVSSRSRFTHESTVNSTPYTRKIFFTNVAGNSVLVRSEVTWRTGSLISGQKVESQTYLYNIYATP